MYFRIILPLWALLVFGCAHTSLTQNFESCQQLLLKSESALRFRSDVLTARTN